MEMKWTSVKDRLPKELNDCLVCAKNVCGKSNIFVAFMISGKWCTYDSLKIKNGTNNELSDVWWNVTHWMPLPKIPEE